MKRLDIRATRESKRMIALMTESNKNVVKIKIVDVGDGESNMVERMLEIGIEASSRRHI